MKISNETINVLKNFSDINQNILVKPGKKIQTLSGMKNILAEASVTESFEQEFGIYDLGEFINTLSLFKEPELKFDNDKSLKVVNGDGKSQVKYFFADKSVILSPTKTIPIDDVKCSFNISSSELDQLKKASAVLNLPDLSATGDGKNIHLSVSDKKNATGNDYSLKVGETTSKFQVNFKVENIKIIPGNYAVQVDGKKVALFENKDKPIKYWIALEPDSSFE